jgi:hypothetical protein
MTETGVTKDWNKITDPTTGNTYYYNSVTGETSWVSPPSEIDALQNPSTESDVLRPVEQAGLGLEVGGELEEQSDQTDAPDAPEVVPTSSACSTRRMDCAAGSKNR